MEVFKSRHPQVLSKSELMLGLGETLDEVKAVITDLQQHHCDMLTLGQYLPTKPLPFTNLTLSNTS